MDAEIFSFPKWKRSQPGWSYQFEMGDSGPSVRMRYGGEEIMEFKMPWEDFGWYVPALIPLMFFQSIVDLSQ